MNFINGIINNKFLIISFSGLFIAQFLKIFTYLITDKKFEFSRFIGSGGMPSSHSSTVMALSTAIGIEYGWDSTHYAIALTFAIIVMYDASGVRYAVGKQARILNSIISEIKEGFKKDGIHIFTSKELRTEKKLKELIGHTKVEVIAGALLGIIIGFVLMKIL